MSDFTDRTLARRLLETRERGFSFELFYSRSKKNYALLALCFLGPLPAFAVAESWTAFWIDLGMLLGCLLRDVSWVRAVGKTWPFSVKVTDWDKVQKLADDEQPSA